MGFLLYDYLDRTLVMISRWIMKRAWGARSRCLMKPLMVKIKKTKTKKVEKTPPQ